MSQTALYIVLICTKVLLEECLDPRQLWWSRIKRQEVSCKYGKRQNIVNSSHNIQCQVVLGPLHVYYLCWMTETYHHIQKLNKTGSGALDKFYTALKQCNCYVWLSTKFCVKMQPIFLFFCQTTELWSKLSSYH